VTRLIVLVAAACACSSLPSSGDGIVALEVRSPLAITLKAGESVTLKARALNSAGDSVGAALFWTTADTTISLDDQGTVTALQGTGQARVQAAVGTLRSELIVITLQPAATGGVRDD
jgi:hypothetical protein